VSDRRPEILALIPARGGSKSIPRKNLLMLAGKPLIAHAIAHAQASRHITRIVVSTDDDEIARVSRDYGAEVPFTRPPELAQDASPDIDVFVHALATLKARDGYGCDAVVHLRPTSPVREARRIDEAIELFLRTAGADSLRSVTPASQSPFKMWRVGDGLMEPVLRGGDRELHSQPRQGLPQVYWQNGYIDIIRPVVIERGQMCGERVLPFIMDEAVYELDYPESIAAAEAALAGHSRGVAPGGRHAV
jgi:CMP-N,N'-diacetyllegionaminic acid synthase